MEYVSEGNEMKVRMVWNDLSDPGAYPLNRNKIFSKE